MINNSYIIYIKKIAMTKYITYTQDWEIKNVFWSYPNWIETKKVSNSDLRVMIESSERRKNPKIELSVLTTDLLDEKKPFDAMITKIAKLNNQIVINTRSDGYTYVTNIFADNPLYQQMVQSWDIDALIKAGMRQKITDEKLNMSIRKADGTEIHPDDEWYADAKVDWSKWDILFQ